MKLFILFFSLVSFSQNLEEIKKLDTIYIYFNYGVYEKNGTNINIDLSKRDEFSKENVVLKQDCYIKKHLNSINLPLHY